MFTYHAILTTFGNKSMNFKFVCETVSRQEVCTGWA